MSGGPLSHASVTFPARVRFLSRTFCFSLSLGALALGALAEERAARAEAPIALTWNAPQGCPSRDAILSEVSRLLGDHAPAPESALVARADVTRAGERAFHLAIAIGEGQSKRTRALDAPTCSELGDAAALVLALAIDPLAGMDAAEDRAAPPPPPSAGAPLAGPENVPIPAPPTWAGSRNQPSIPLFAVPPSPELFAAPHNPRIVRALALTGGETGMFRSPSPMFRLGLSYGRAGLRWDGHLMFVWGDRIPAPDIPTKGGTFGMGGVQLSMCSEWVVDRANADRSAVFGGVCGTVEGGVIYGSSDGVSKPGSAIGPWIAPVAQTYLRWRVAPRTHVHVDLGFGVPLIRPSFAIVGLGTVHQVALFSGRIGLGLEIDLALTDAK